ncbi:M48 family metallopeptidase [Sulfurospirillum sp. 1612]|uniref:M48 family metallopeptidase n=1 Tax=Sulfurospirillum sp. 1612 TaxID=3094835 RepID=UPI002F94515F
MLIWISLIYTVYALVRFYAAVMEIGFVLKAKRAQPVILSASNFIKAGNYKIATTKMELLQILYDLLIFFWWFDFGLNFLDRAIVIDNEILHAVVFVDLFIAINYFLGLPFDWYKTFSLDKKFGFSNMDFKMYLMDQLKASVLFLVFGSLVIALLSWIILVLPNWWIWGFGVVFLILLFINMVYPTWIAPLFNKFTPLQDEDLKNAIEALLQKAGLKSSGVFSLDASKRDNRLNAYFGGLGKSKRVVLFDTLIAKLDKTELLAVLGHELGHFKHKDIIKNIFSSGLMLLIMFAIFGNLPSDIFLQLGVSNGSYMTLVFFLLFSPVLSFLFMPFFSFLSRKNEYAADAYGSECESKEALASALMKLADANKSFPYSHPLTIALYFTHPPLVTRLKHLGVDVNEDKRFMEEHCHE